MAEMRMYTTEIKAEFERDEEAVRLVAQAAETINNFPRARVITVVVRDPTGRVVREDSYVKTREGL